MLLERIGLTSATAALPDGLASFVSVAFGLF